MIKSKNSIILHDFMMGGGLQLKNLNLLIYALVYNFWSNGREMYQSCSSVAGLIGCTREAVNRSLEELERYNYIIRLSQKGRYGNHYYTINPKTLEEKLAARCDETAQLRCDETAQGGVMIPHREVCENRTGRCDETAHNNIIIKEKEIKGDKNTEGYPLPLNCFLDEECKRLWSIILSSSKWAGRSEEALAEAAKVLADQPVEVCRLMLTHTIEGDYPRIYEPTSEMIRRAKSKSPRCAEISHLVTTSCHDDDIDKEVLSRLHPHFPANLKERIYGQNGGRALRFRMHDGQVTISCPLEVGNWLKTIPEILNPILNTWVGPSYSGYSFDIKSHS